MPSRARFGSRTVALVALPALLVLGGGCAAMSQARSDRALEITVVPSATRLARSGDESMRAMMLMELVFDVTVRNNLGSRLILRDEDDVKVKRVGCNGKPVDLVELESILETTPTAPYIAMAGVRSTEIRASSLGLDGILAQSGVCRLVLSVSSPDLPGRSYESNEMLLYITD